MDNLSIILIRILIIIIVLILLVVLLRRDKFSNSNVKNTIPKIIYLTHKESVPDYVIQNWKKLNPNYTVKFYNDNDCLEFLKEEYPESYSLYYEYLSSQKGAGPIKADFWRVCILYKYGGVYVDADIEPIKPIDYFLESNTSFLSCGSKFTGPNPHIIACHANDRILKECLHIYETQKFKQEYSYWGHSIVYVMLKAYKKLISNYNNNVEKNYYLDSNYKVQMLLEKHVDWNNDYCVYKGKKVLNNRYSSYDKKNHTY